MERAKNTLLALACIALALLAITRPAGATPSFGTNSGPWNAVTTFQSIGLYWKPTGANGQRAAVRFKEQGAADWRQGLDLWWDARSTGEYRGSLVELKPNTTYEIQLKLGTGDWTNTTTNCNTGATECFIPPTTSACNSTNQTMCTRTWSEDFTPEAGYLITVPATGIRRIVITGENRTTPLHESTTNGVMTIKVSNHADASYAVIQGANYVDGEASSRSLVQPADSNLADDDDAQTNCIDITGASHIVIRGLKLSGCARRGIFINANSHHIVIDDNEIVGWGGWGDNFRSTTRLTNHPNGDGAIACWNPTNKAVNQVVVQRNQIHDPRWASTHWNQTQVRQPNGTMQPTQMPDTHPTGPSGTAFDVCGSNHVIRYNDIYATEPDPTKKWYEHAEQQIKYMMDGMTGAENKEAGEGGFPWADSDIYGNFISHIHDDGIEAEGANRNVRIWKNYTNKVFVSIANVYTELGPLYVWRNVTNLQARMRLPNVDPGSTALNADRAPFIKAGTDPENGRHYYFHNTALQAPKEVCGASAFTCGPGAAIRRDGQLYNVHTFNNIWQNGWDESLFNMLCGNAGTDPHKQCQGGRDMYNASTAEARSSAQVPASSTFNNNGIQNTTPTFAAGGGYPTSLPTIANGGVANFRLAAGTPGEGTHASHAMRINNFNDRDDGDVGAQQGGTNMVFGRAAMPPPSGPSVTINQAQGQADPSTSTPINFTAVFSQSVTGFTGADVTIGGDAGGTKTATVTGSGTTYNVAVSGMTTAGSVIVSIPANRAQNDGGNGNRASTSTNNRVDLSVVVGGPSVTIDQAAGQPDPDTSAPVNFTAIFSQSVTGFTGSDVTVSGTAGGTKTVTVTGSGTTYNVAVAGMTTAGSVIVSIPAGVAQNSTGSGNSASTSNDNQVAFNGTGPTAYELYVSVTPGPVVNRTAGERLDFSVEPADGRALASVRFYVDDVLKATDTAAPFTYSWTTAAGDAPGGHVLRVETTDSQGNLASETRNLTLLADHCGGLVSASSVAQGTPLQVQGVCSAYKTVTEMEFSVDGAQRSSDVSSSYTWTLDTSALTVGSHTLAINGKFAPSGSASASTTVNVTAAELALTLSPGPVILPDETITFSAVASDGRQLQQVSFYVDGAFKAGTVVAPHAYQWTPGNVAASYGRHTLVVQAADANGNLLTASRDLLVQPRTCSILLGLSRYKPGGSDAVYVNPHRIAQGLPVAVQSTCSSWMNVTQVEFYLDGALQRTDATAPYTWTLGTTGLALGIHTLATKGRLAGGGETNDSVTIEIVAP